MRAAKISLIFNYFIVALLLNSVNVFVIQMSNQFHASEGVISAFAPVKDFTILVASFILASLIPKMGPRKSIVIGLLCILVACVMMGVYPAIVTSFLFFILLGISFSLIKVATYASVLSITKNSKEHTSFVSLLEGFFMVGILSMSWLFGIFEGFGNWTYVFWIIAVLTIIAIIFYLTTPKDLGHTISKEYSAPVEHSKGLLKTLFSSPIMWFFIVITVCYVFIENGFTIWLPTFDNHFLNIDTSISIELISIFSASLAIGRLLFSAILKFVDNCKVLVTCIVFGLLILAYSMFAIKMLPQAQHTITTWSGLPTVAFWLPLIGFMISPIYPTFCSVLLTSFPEKRFQSPISSIIVIFSAVGGMAGAAVMGYMFKVLGAAHGIAVPAVPLFIILILTIPYFMAIKRHASKQNK